MALLCGIDESGMCIYDIPDSELSKFKQKSRWMDEETRVRLFPGKDQLTKEDAQVVIPVAAAGGDVQGFGTNHVCCAYTGEGYVCWPC
ncbi:MAG TPA: hypothetical protein VLZ05_17385 [Mycobacterium sp.]|nr:hypothetical protein [Mycobacterium sp.]HUH70468.1 hypothetical protein [Mycobacterium sp.]